MLVLTYVRLWSAGGFDIASEAIFCFHRWSFFRHYVVSDVFIALPVAVGKAIAVAGYFVYLNKENNTLVETKYVFRFLKRQKNDTVTIKVTKFSKPHKETIPNSIMKTSETINVVLPKARDENPNHFPESIPLFSNGRHTIYLAYNGYNGPHHKTYEFGLYVKSTNGRWAAFQVFQASLKKDNPEWKHLHTKLEGHIRLRKDIPQSVKLIANSALPATDRNTQPLELNFQLNSADERIAAMTIWNAKPENCT